VCFLVLVVYPFYVTPRDSVLLTGWLSVVGPGVPVYTVNECRVLGGLAPLIFDLGATWE
jgi:hypothetical protein